MRASTPCYRSVFDHRIRLRIFPPAWVVFRGQPSKQAGRRLSPSTQGLMHIGWQSRKSLAMLILTVLTVTVLTVVYPCVIMNPNRMTSWSSAPSWTCGCASRHVPNLGEATIINGNSAARMPRAVPASPERNGQLCAPMTKTRSSLAYLVNSGEFKVLIFPKTLPLTRPTTKPSNGHINEYGTSAFPVSPLSSS